MATATQSSGAVPLTELTVTFRWWSAGEFRLGADGGLAPPPLEKAPAIYRLCFTARKMLYVGEAKNVWKRMHRDYRKPGRSQDGKTKHRIHRQLVEALTRGEVCALDVCDTVEVQLGEARRPADLTSTTMRRLVENAALIAERETGWTFLNKDS